MCSTEDDELCPKNLYVNTNDELSVSKPLYSDAVGISLSGVYFFNPVTETEKDAFTTSMP